MPDLSPFLLRRGWGNLREALYLPPMYFWSRRRIHNTISKIAIAGGLKSYFKIPDETIVEYGCDRVLVRNPVDHIREAVSLNPNAVVIFDVPLAQEDTEDEVIAKLAVNHDAVERCCRFLKEKRLRDRFLVVGVCQADYPDFYLEEATWLGKHVDIIGVPSAGLNLKRKTEYLHEVVELIAKEISDRIIQLMGYGFSNIDELKEVLRITAKHNSVIILEGSSVVRQSRVRQVLAMKKAGDSLDWMNINYVEEAASFTSKQCFEYNMKLLHGVASSI